MCMVRTFVSIFKTVSIALAGWLVMAAVGLAVVACASSGAVAADLVVEATFSSSIANGWERVERWRDTNTAFTQEPFPTDGRGDHNGQRVTFFGGIAHPHSSRFLLYYAPGWSSANSKPVPVLLVHGAIQDADLAWADPNELGSNGCGRFSCPSSGLMQDLSADGFRVFPSRTRTATVTSGRSRSPTPSR